MVSKLIASSGETGDMWSDFSDVCSDTYTNICQNMFSDICTGICFDIWSASSPQAGGRQGRGGQIALILLELESAGSLRSPKLGVSSPNNLIFFFGFTSTAFSPPM